jgi:hypothetical protein
VKGVNGVKSVITAIATVVGIVAAGVASYSAGDTRMVATVVSLYGAFVVVVASYPGRRPIFARTRHV